MFVPILLDEGVVSYRAQDDQDEITLALLEETFFSIVAALPESDSGTPAELV
jgi:hypothetical protein